MSSSIELFLDDYTVSPENFRWGHCYLVSALGGARSDFVYSWLCNLKISHQLKCPWYIDIYTGKTSTPYSSTLFNDSVLKGDGADFLQWMLSTYSSTSPIIAQKSHEIGYIMPGVKKLNPYVTIVRITPTLDDVTNVVWEFYAKTYLRNVKFSFWNFHFLFPEIDFDQPMSDLVKIDFISRAVRKTMKIFIDDIGLNYNLINDVPIVHMPYKHTIDPQGSYVLADLLGIDVTAAEHDLWAKAISAAVAPAEVVAFGKIWSRSEFEQIYAEVLSTIIE